MLPTELWQHIAGYLDYYELSRLKCVSKRWKAMITAVMERKYGWYIKCREEVPEKWWSSILAHEVHPVNDRIRCEDFHAEKNFPSIWKSLYSSWIEWTKIGDKDPSVVIKKSIFEEPQHNFWVMDLAVEGNIVGIVMANGVWESNVRRICLYDVTQPSADPIREIDATESGPCYLRFGKKGRDVIAFSLSDNDDPLSWNVKTQEPSLYTPRTPENAELSFICTSFGYSCLVTMAPDFENKRHCRTEIRKIGSEEDPRFVSFELEYASSPHQVQADGDILMILLDNDEKNVVVRTISIRENKLKESYVTSLDLDGQILFYKLFPPCVAACIEHEFDKIGFSVSGREWKIYDMTKDLKLEAPVVHGRNGYIYKIGLLVLMLMSGNIKIIYVDDPDCLDSSLELMPSRMVEFTSSPACQFPLLRLTEYNSNIYIVMTNDNQLIVVTF